MDFFPAAADHLLESLLNFGTIKFMRFLRCHGLAITAAVTLTLGEIVVAQPPEKPQSTPQPSATKPSADKPSAPKPSSQPNRRKQPNRPNRPNKKGSVPPESGALPQQSDFDPTAEWGKMLETWFGAASADEENLLTNVEVTPRQESEYGEQLVAAYLAELTRQEIRYTDAGRDVEYLQQLAATLRPMMQHAARYARIRIVVVDSDSIDARSFPGGTLVFFRGLLEFAETEAALVGIVGHELSHLDRQHQLLPLKRNRLLQNSTDRFTDFSPQRLVETLELARVLSRPFRPEDEAAADRDGAEWAYRAGYDPREMARLFARMQQRTKDPKFPFASLFRTHPYNDERHAAIHNQFRELQRQQPEAQLYRGRKNLSARVPKSLQAFDE